MFSLTLVLSIISSVLRLWLITRLFLIHRQREYPLFVAHNVVAVVTLVATVSLKHRAIASYLAYWIGEAASTVLALLVILAVFKPAGELVYMRHPSYRFLLPIGITAAITIPVWQAIYRPLRLTLLGHVASGLYSFVLGILCLQAVILLVCIALSKSIPWGNYDFAILAGFGVSALVKWIGYLVRWNYGARFEDWFQILLPGSTIGAVLVWLIAFSRSEPKITKREPNPNELQRLIDLLREHTEFVKQIFKSPPFRRPTLPDRSG